MKSVYFSITPLNKAVNVYSFALVLDYLLGAFYLPLMHQSIPAAPSPPPPPFPPPQATAGHLPAFSVPGVGHLQILRCPGPTPGLLPSF